MGKFVDLTDKIYGDFKVIKFDNSKGKYKYYWLCKCVNCGKEKSIKGAYLRNGRCIKCTCNSRYRREKDVKGYSEDLSNRRFGRLFITSFAYSKYSHSYWNCICDCGNKTIKSVGYFKKSKYLMCDGCLHSYTKKDEKDKMTKVEIPFKEIAFQEKTNKIEINGDITILNDKIIIDTKNLDKILSFKRYVSINSKGYPYIHWKGGELFLHRFVVGLPQYYDNETQLIAEHINGNRLECLESNLRVCKKSVNAINCKIYKNNKSGHKGVTWDKSLNKWQVSIQYQKENHYLGVYKDKEEAIRVREEAEEKYFGEYNRKEEYLHNGKI